MAAMQDGALSFLHLLAWHIGIIIFEAGHGKL
jgi:hypothetical protein